MNPYQIEKLNQFDKFYINLSPQQHFEPHNNEHILSGSNPDNDIDLRDYLVELDTCD
jgi:hypothetical protein